MKSLDYLLPILSIANVLILCMLFHNTYTVPPVTSLTPNQRINILRVRMDKMALLKGMIRPKLKMLRQIQRLLTELDPSGNGYLNPSDHECRKGSICLPGMSIQDALGI
jgi:hypothetical protein